MADILNETIPVIGIAELSDSEHYDSDTAPEISCSVTTSDTSSASTSSTSSSDPYSNSQNHKVPTQPQQRRQPPPPPPLPSKPQPTSMSTTVTIPNTFNQEVMEKLESLYNSPYQNELNSNNCNNKSATIKPKVKPEPTPRLRFAPNPPNQNCINTTAVSSPMLDSISESISNESSSNETANLKLIGRFCAEGFSRRRINSETCLSKLGSSQLTYSIPEDNRRELVDNNAATTKSKSISNLCSILAPIPENQQQQHHSTMAGTRCSSQISTSTPNSTTASSISSSSHHQSSLELFRKNQHRAAFSRPNRFTVNSTSLIGKQGGVVGGTLPNHVMSYSYGSLCHLPGACSVNSTLTHEEMLRIRYLTYGTSAQLRQEYDKFLPWPSLTEFRLRRKFRRFKRRARKLLGTSNLLNRIQNVRRLVRIRSRSSSSSSTNHNQLATIHSKTSSTLPISVPTCPSQSTPDQTVSRSSSLTSLLNLIEEANKNLINSFNNSPKLTERPKCPPRLKRAASSINVSGTRTPSNGTTLQRNSSAAVAGILRTSKDFNNNRDHSQNADKFWNSKMLPDSYQIAFIDQIMQKSTNSNQSNGSKTATLKPNTTSVPSTDQNDSDTISVKSLESYFGSGAPMPESGTTTKPTGNGVGQNSKVLRVRSHFQINNGTVYLEDSDWEMCSEIDACIDDGGPESIKSNSVDEAGSSNNLDTVAMTQPAKESKKNDVETNKIVEVTTVANKVDAATVAINSDKDGALIESSENVKAGEKENLEDDAEENEDGEMDESKLCTIKHQNLNQIKQQFIEMAAHAEQTVDQQIKPTIKPKPKVLVPVVKPVELTKSSCNDKLEIKSGSGQSVKPKFSVNKPKLAVAVKRPIKKMAPKAPPPGPKNYADQDGPNKSKQSVYHKNCCRSKTSQQTTPANSTSSASLANHHNSSSIANNKSIIQKQHSKTQDSILKMNSHQHNYLKAPSVSDIGAHKKIDPNIGGGGSASRNIDNDKNSPSQQQQRTSNNKKSTKLPQATKTKSKIMLMKTNLLSKTKSSSNKNPVTPKTSSTNTSVSKGAKPSKSTLSSSSLTKSSLSSTSHNQMALIDRIANKFMMNKKSNGNNLNNNNNNSNNNNETNQQTKQQVVQMEHATDDDDDDDEERDSSDGITTIIVHDDNCSIVSAAAISSTDHNLDDDHQQQSQLQLQPTIDTTDTVIGDETTTTKTITCLDENSAIDLSTESTAEIATTDPTLPQMDTNLTKSQTNVLELIDKFNNLAKPEENVNENQSDGDQRVVQNNQDTLFRSILTNNNNSSSNGINQPSQPANLNLECQFEQYFNQFYQSSKLSSSSSIPTSSSFPTNSNSNRDDINLFCSRLIQDLENKFNQRSLIEPLKSPETVQESQPIPPQLPETTIFNNNNFQNDSNLLLIFFLYNQRQMLQEILHQMLTTSVQNRNQVNNNLPTTSKLSPTSDSGNFGNSNNSVAIVSKECLKENNLDENSIKNSKSDSEKLSEFNRLIQLLQTSLKQQQQINAVPIIDPVPVKIQPESNAANLTKVKVATNSGPRKEPLGPSSDSSDNSNGSSANVNCSGNNRFVNKIVLNNSINQFNFNMNSESNSLPPPAAPSIVNVINDNSANYAANLFDVSINQSGNDDSQYCSDSDQTDYGVVSVNAAQPDVNSRRQVASSTSGDGGQHRTVLEIKNPTNKFGGLFSTLRYQLEKKRNKNRMERMKKSQQRKDTAKADSLTTALENCNRNGGPSSGVTVANTSTLEIKGIVAECLAASVATNNHNEQHSKMGGTLRRLLSPSRDGSIGSSFGGSTTKLLSSSSSKSKRESIMEISNPNPIGLESLFGTIRRQDTKSTKANFPVNDQNGFGGRTRSEMNFRSIIKLNEQVTEEEDCNSSHYDSIGNQSDCSAIYDRIDGRRYERQRNAANQRFGSQLEIRSPHRRVPNHPNLLSHPMPQTSTNSRSIYYGSQINLSGSKDHANRYRPKPVVTFTLPRSFKSNKQSSNRPNMENIADRFEHHSRYIRGHGDVDDEDLEEEEFNSNYDEDCDGQHGPGRDTPIQQDISDSDSSDPESDRTIRSSSCNRNPTREQPRRRQQLYLPPKSPDESIDDECEYFLTPCKLNERYFRFRNRYR